MKTRLLPCIAIAVSALASLHAAPPETESDPGFVAHEWGTFTSVQGADGNQMIWNPLVAPELPKFVYDRVHSRALSGIQVAGKTGTASRQRLETPVIYFYNEGPPRTLDVSVFFPHGSVTEWYPQRSAISPSAGGQAQPALHWKKIDLLSARETNDARLPQEKVGSHYYAARETDSAVLGATGDNGAVEWEKFLFYRGVGTDTAPLTVTLDSADAHRVTLKNTSSTELRNLFLYEVRADGGNWLKVDRLAPGESRAIALPSQPGNASLQGLADSLRQALTHEGLYEREAAAMVKTWESAWFSERGMRVLYTLPRQWTDKVLPLQINPPPRELQRVMVARAEIITPEMEQALREQIDHSMAKDANRAKIVAETQALGLGRFMEPALVRVLNSAPHSDAFQAHAWELLQAVRTSPAPGANAPAATITE